MPFKKGVPNPKAKKFEQGQSGNPNGRPQGVRNRSTIAKMWLETVTEWTNPLTGEKQMLSLEDQITLAQIKEARDSGSATAYKNIMDSRFGAVQQKIDVNNTGELLIPNINIFNNAPPMAGSEDEIDGDRPNV